MNIVFIGYRGTGKSTVATILGQRLGRKVISTDEEIVKEAKQSIPQLIEQFGWDHFRTLETEVCQKLTGQENLVIDTGGGLILKEENVKMLKENGKIFWLTAEVSTIASRISGDTQRPSLSGTKSFVEEIEEILISGDVGVETTLEIIENVKQRVRKEKYEESHELYRILREEVAGIFPEKQFREDGLSNRPYVILVIGVNGTGKTTTIGKLANRFRQLGKKVLLAAGDTFRAAAIEQLEIWAQRVNVDLVKHQFGADPGAVAFDAIQAGRSRQADVVIIDTAGRLHTKVNLMEELKKVQRVIQKVDPGAPHLNLLVLDGTTGQNALNQARQFIDAVGVDGIVLTKLDGTAKGGAVIGIAHQLKLPVEYIGVGEGIDDLQPFDPQLYAESLFANAE